MPLYVNLPQNHDEFDVVIAGGGTSGCIIAARLADADPNLSILVIEAGLNNVGEATLTHPAFWISQIIPSSQFTLFYQGAPSKFLSGRGPVVPAGNTLGGGSSINLMQYSRGQRCDYDNWKTPGWSADDILPYMKKLETYSGPDPRQVHGHDGPIHVSGGTFRCERFSKDLLDSLGKAGWPETEDLNTMDTVNRSMRAMRYVDEQGNRQDTATKYLHPRLDEKHPNLHVVVRSRVDRILFNEDKKAVAVVYQPESSPESAPARTVKARKTVVLTAGAMGSPLILERSGVGNPDIIKRSGIELVADLPAVGENYDDHHMMIYAYKSNLEPNETLDGVISGRSKPADMIANKDKLLGWNGVDVQAKVRPSDEDVASLGPQFQAAWEKDFKPQPEKPLMLLASTICFPGDPTGQPEGQYFGMVSFTVHPFSRGHIHIRSSDLYSTPEFDPGFFSDDGFDIESHLWMYKKQREITRRMGVFQGEVASWHPQFPPGSKAACLETPDGTETANIEYSAEDDEAILQWLRGHVDTTWHSMGTCRMAPVNEGGVVDSRLNVHGVQGLKVADMGIPPSNVAANTNNTAMVIGEKAADILIQDLGLST
ncbi:GMC oxidoreductase-domain-containing protein [Stachybotrys elegans]|uniref:GMC oxidoreductase-domain-containing protein n=1 Tax=Stachybotrys elegans TaxID=80388 RepID=A0A8K0SIA0_9HYPO|nr:GMC oxidoreductase-domain-containing protein [Stachybotrys elegans]